MKDLQDQAVRVECVVSWVECFVFSVEGLWSRVHSAGVGRMVQGA